MVEVAAADALDLAQDALLAEPEASDDRAAAFVLDRGSNLHAM
jgi:hypothetical protein